MEQGENKKNYSNKMEIVRFLVVGLIATIFDFGTKVIVNTIIGNQLSDGWKTFIGYACGFVIGVIVNYLLSTFWVFKNVKDEKSAKSSKGVLLFLLFAVIGFGIGLGITYGLGYFFQATTGYNIIDFKLFDMSDFWGHLSRCLSSAEFWLYFLVFCIQTVIVLVWNYVTRKKFIYIAPSEENIVNNNEEETSDK